MFIIIALLTFVAFADTFLALTLLVRDSKNVSKRFFGASILFLVIWTVSTILLLQSDNQELLSITIYFFLVTPLIMSFFLDVFLKLSIAKRISKTFYISTITVIVAVAYTVVFAPEIISSVEIVGDVNSITVNTLPFLIYSGFLSAIFSQITTAYFAISKMDTPQRAQWNTVLIGIFMTIIISSATNIILPLVGTGSLIWIGPLSTAITLATVTFAITRYSLFDVRVVAARAVAYAVSVGFIIAFFVFFITVISRIDVFSSTENINLQRMIFIALSVTSAIIYQPVKKFFDKLTNRIFYRDAYDSQVFINEFNETLVTTVDLEILLQKTASIVVNSLKTTDAVFYLRKTSYFEERTFDSSGNKAEIKNLDLISEKSAMIQGKIFSTESENDKKEAPELYRLLAKNDTAIMVRLVSTKKYHVKGAGLLFIGPRRSGSLYTKQDIKLLSIIANELIIAIENILRYEEIEQFNVTLQKKTDAATKELKKSNEKLLALDQAKDEFVSMASHQLRTPLTSIKGYIAMVLDGDAGKINETQEQMLRQTFISSQRMVYLISDLLNVSRLKTGKFHIDTKPVLLASIVQGELSQLEDEMKIKKLKLLVNLPKQEEEIELDELKTRQVIMNFVDNAIYYTPTGGTIEITVKQNDSETEFTVKDTGIGVPKEQQQKLFTKFYRADNARKIRPDGTGLGLFMAKKVIEAQGGEILFTSKEGRGSTFGFTYKKIKKGGD